MTYEHKVQYYETDAMKIVHHSNYIRWMEEARVHFLEQIGCPLESLEEMGITIPVLDVSCKYINMTRFGESAEVTAFIDEFKGVRMHVKYIIRRSSDGEVSCTAESSHCFLKDGKVINLKRKYPEIYARFESEICNDDGHKNG